MKRKTPELFEPGISPFCPNRGTITHFCSWILSWVFSPLVKKKKKKTIINSPIKRTKLLLNILKALI